MITKYQASRELNITDRTRRRLCEKYRNELLRLGYNVNSKFINSHCIEFLKSKIKPQKANQQKEIRKSCIALKLGITTKTLSKWFSLSKLLKKLERTGYRKTQKSITEEQYEIVKEHLNID